MPIENVDGVHAGRLCSRTAPFKLHAELLENAGDLEASRATIREGTSANKKSYIYHGRVLNECV